MIKGFIVGYYRSGTTICQKVITESNPDLYVIHEPSVPPVYNQVKEGKKKQVRALHGWEFLGDFLDLPKTCIDEWLQKAVIRGMYFDPKEAFQTFDPFHRCEKNIMIKTCQSHYVIDWITDRYDCRYVFLLRDPVEVFSSHGGVNESSNLSFFFDFIYNNLINIKQLERKENKIEQFLDSWCFLNNKVLEHAFSSGKGLLITFNQMVRHTHPTFKRIAKFLGINYRVAVGSQVDHRRPRIVSADLRRKFEKHLPKYRKEYPELFRLL